MGVEISASKKHSCAPNIGDVSRSLELLVDIHPATDTIIEEAMVFSLEKIFKKGVIITLQAALQFPVQSLVKSPFLTLIFSVFKVSVQIEKTRI